MSVYYLRPNTNEPVHKDGEPPDNGGMEVRVAKLEAVIPTLATKVDMAELRVEMHKEFNTQTWRLIGAMMTFGTLLTAAVYYIAINVT